VTSNTGFTEPNKGSDESYRCPISRAEPKVALMLLLLSVTAFRAVGFMLAILSVVSVAFCVVAVPLSQVLGLFPRVLFTGSQKNECCDGGENGEYSALHQGLF
jgi:hypothetical protein